MRNGLYINDVNTYHLSSLSACNPHLGFLICSLPRTPRYSPQESPAPRLNFKSESRGPAIGRHGGLHGNRRPKILTLCAALPLLACYPFSQEQSRRLRLTESMMRKMTGRATDSTSFMESSISENRAVLLFRVTKCCAFLKLTFHFS